MRPRSGSARPVRGLSKEKSLLHERSEVDRRVAQGPFQGPESSASRLQSAGIGLLLVVIALLVFSGTKPFRFYDHFEWQAEAFLEGRTAIRYPVESQGDSPGNAFFNDVRPVPSDDGVSRGDTPFPPLPAILLLPFVALWGHDADGQFIFAVVGAVDVGIAWWMLGRLPIRPWVRLATTVFLAFGTVLWYAAQLGTTWYQAHVLAVGLALLSVGVALRADPNAAIDKEDRRQTEEAADPRPGSRLGSLGGLSRSVRAGVDGRQFLAGLLFGLACTARLTVLFAAPFFLFVGGGGTWVRRGFSAGLGAAIPVGALLLYNLVSTGHVLHPGYQFLYEQEAGFYTTLGYNLSWGIEDPRYIPQNLGIMLFSAPAILPDIYPAGLGGGQALCVDPGAMRGLFDLECPLALPRDTGMSLVLTSPAYLLALPILRRYGRNRVVTGAALAILIVAFINVMHFSQGWVQFGYRFSLDFVPWALLLVAIGMERLRTSIGIAVAVGLVVLSIVVNAWGVAWGNLLGW